MRFDRLRLENFKPYADADLDLDDGVTVIHGLNGSGKSSLLDACFFALYGSGALDETLDDVVTTGADEAEVDLWFTHDDVSYHVHRRLRRSGERIQTADCTLEGPDATYEGARDVRARIASMLRMDAEAFVNCAYVRQGEVNKLINATPGQRQAMLDDLLQLGALETYRERAGQARLGVEDVRTAKRELLDDLDRRIEEKESQELHATLNELQRDRKTVDEKVGRYESQREKARETRDDAEAVLDEYKETRSTLETLDEEVETLESTVRETESQRDALREQRREVQERLDTLGERIDTALAETDLDAADPGALAERRTTLEEQETAHRERAADKRTTAKGLETQATNLTSKAEDLDERAADRRERASTLADDAEEAADELSTLRERIDDLATTIEETRETFESAPCAFGEAESYRTERREKREELRDREQTVASELEAARRRVADAEELLADGKCPECGQAVEDSPHVAHLDEDRARIEELTADLDAVRTERESVETELERADSLVAAEDEVETLRERRTTLTELADERAESIDEMRERAARLREEAETLETQATETREAAETQRERAATVQSEVTDAEEAADAVRERRERLSTLADLLDDRDQATAEVERLRERRENLAELNAERTDRLDEKRARRRDLRDAVDDETIETAREDKARAEQYLEQVGEALSTLEERRDSLQGRIGGVEQDIRQLEELRDQRSELGAQVEALETLHDETTSLETMYGDLRADLRQRNVETLERMLNETFDLVYGNDAYSHIRLDGEYQLTVFQKDGTALAPEQLSGGERALFNLSLRCAIYRLLAEGIDGAAPMPPLILDEPTVFLDAGHVSRLVELVAEMRSLGVRQIVIVSHDDELVGAADDLVRVEKDPTSNRSTVERLEDPTLTAVGDD